MATTGPFSGMVQGISKIATGTPAAFCRACYGGSFDRKPNNIIVVGIGSQRQVIKGVDIVTLTAQISGIAVADLALWFPATAVVQVGSFPDFLVEVDDGTNGAEWVLSGGQPVSAKVSHNGNSESKVDIELTLMALATDAAAGTDVPVYHTDAQHPGWIASDVKYAASAKKTASWDLSVDLGTKHVGLCDAKVAGALTVPTGFYTTQRAYTFNSVTHDVFEGDAMEGDTWTPGNITVELNNQIGAGADDVIFTCSNFVPDGFNMPFESEDVVGFAHSFIPGSGTQHGRITVAAHA